MGYNCKWTEIVIGLLVILFAWWTPIYTNWILTILGLLMIWHAFRCTNCYVPHGNMDMKTIPIKPMKVVKVSKKPVVKKAAKKKKKR